MQEDLLQHIHTVCQHGLHLKKRVTEGEALVLENEQESLKRLLLSDLEARRWADYAGSPDGVLLGIRYALVCWLDEIFLQDSPWMQSWNEKKLEMALYGTNDRAWRFWEQARLIEGTGRHDNLLPFFLAVMLGFRGDYREDPLQLQAWVDGTRRLLMAGKANQWVKPPHLEPRTNVPPLRGRENLQWMVVSGCILLMIFIPLVALFLVRSLNTPALPSPSTGGTISVSTENLPPAPKTLPKTLPKIPGK